MVASQSALYTEGAEIVTEDTEGSLCSLSDLCVASVFSVYSECASQ